MIQIVKDTILILIIDLKNKKIVLDFGGYQPSFLFGTESPAVRAQ